MVCAQRHLGLDLGGTNIKAAVVEGTPDGGLRVVATDSRLTEAAGGPARVLTRLTDLGRDAVRRWGPVDGVGVGVPGLFDGTTGRIMLFPNLPGPWAGHPMREPVARALGLPVHMINDARAFTLAETRMGAGRGSETVVCMVLGTGVGGGVVVDGRLRFGRDGRAGEIGHQIVVPDGPLCGCGGRGCVEAVASAAAVAELGGRTTAAEVYAAAGRGDERAAAAVRTVAGYLALGIANMLTVLLPERVVIGGGIAGAGDVLLDPLRAEVIRRAVLVPPAWYEIVPAELGPFAGAIGAALWAREATDGRGGHR